MASSSQIRRWWAAWECDVDRMVKAPFPGEGRTWQMWVANASAPVWAAVGQIMASEPYLFKETAGGTYNCRDIGGTGSRSIHAYGLALDLNPKANPHRAPLQHNYPDTFIERMEGIRASGVQALTWGGRWTKPDAMHWQINVPPGDCDQVTWDRGDDMATGPNGEPNWDKVSEWAQNSWTAAYKAGLLTKDSQPQDVVEVEQMMVYLNRAGII